MVKKKAKSKFTLRERFHYWWCDKLNLASYDDLVYLTEYIDKTIKIFDKGFQDQHKFNQLVTKELGLNIAKVKEIEKEEEDRGVYQ